MRLTRWGWVLLGFALTIGVIWAGANVWTLLEERDNGDHLTKIERIVIGLKHTRRAASTGGDAIQPAQAGQQSPPAKAPAHHHGDVDRHTDSDPVDPAPQAPAAEAPEPSPAATGKPAGRETLPAPEAESLPESTPEADGKGLQIPGVTLGEPGCPVKAAGISVCTK